MRTKSINELHELAEEENLDLPMPAEDIADLEAAGHVVDLVTGEVILNGANLYIDSPALGKVTNSEGETLR